MESNERCGMGMKDKGIGCGVIVWIWVCGKDAGKDFTQRMYQSKIEGRGVRGRSPVGWMNKVEK